MNIKKNLIYSTILTLSTYMVPLLVFPYISRVLGPTPIGAIDTVDNLIDYCILFSMMGMTSLGIREIAKNKNNRESLHFAFNNLFWLNTISTGIVFILLCITILLLPDLQHRIDLLIVGSIKLIANLFAIEWFYRGLEDFRYITIRSVIIRVLFIICVFLFVTKKSDYIIYYILFVGMYVSNAVCNWIHKAKFISVSYKRVQLGKYFKPFVFLGVFAMLSAIYTKLTLPVLSISCGNEEAGYYATATRMYQVIIALISSLISVLIPRMSVLIREHKAKEIQELYNSAFKLLYFLAIPIIIYVEFFASDIIKFFAGQDFENAVLPMKLIMILVLIIGTEQILIMQLLIPLKKDKEVVMCGLLGVITWIILSILLIPTYKSTGAAIVWIAAEAIVMLSAAYQVKHAIGFQIPIKSLTKSCIVSIPYIVIGYSVYIYTEKSITKIIISIIAFAIYTALTWKYQAILFGKTINE